MIACYRRHPIQIINNTVTEPVGQMSTPAGMTARQTKGMTEISIWPLSLVLSDYRFSISENSFLPYIRWYRYIQFILETLLVEGVILIFKNVIFLNNWSYIYYNIKEAKWPPWSRLQYHIPNLMQNIM